MGRPARFLFRRISNSALASAATLVLLAACSGPAVTRAELLVFVDGDVTGLDGVHVDVTGPDGTHGLSQTFALGSRPDQVRLPFSFGVTPIGDDASRVVTISIEGRAGAVTRVRAMVRSAFVPGEVRRVDVLLQRVCEPLYASCETMSLTCRDGACVSPMIDANGLPLAHPDAGPPDTDGGTVCATSAGPLACGGSVVTGDTAAGMAALGGNACPSGLRYPGHEGVALFTVPTPALVHIVSHRISDPDHAYDLFVLGGPGSATSCDDTASCAAWDSNGTDVDQAVFHAVAGAPYYVVLDGTDANATTTYSLSVTCDVCGDGVPTAPEQCDDANTGDGDGCSASCTIEPGFTCSGVPSTCSASPCGNGTPERGETCDDGNTIDGDGCSSHCLAEAFTGISLDMPSATVPGSLDETDPVFARPLADCATDSGFTPHYDAYVVQNTGTAPIMLTLEASWSGDGFLFVYAPPFDPTMPTAGCALGNDNLMGSPMNSHIEGYPLGPGAQAIVVATEFEVFSAAGPYSLVLAARAL